MYEKMHKFKIEFLSHVVIFGDNISTHFEYSHVTVIIWLLHIGL
jgi:hypothetical protein